VEEESVKQLFRRFVSDECGQGEILEVMEMLQNQDAVNWFGEVMDQMQETEAAENEDITRHNLEQRYEALERKIDTPVYETRPRQFWWSTYSGIAASLAGILMLTSIAMYFYKQDIKLTHKTGFGEIKNLTLPDGSTVVLNSNSMITYSKNWQKVRNVRLDGEAYFHVTKTIDRKPFTVEMTKTGKIEVLGTDFNVNHRAKNAKVVLRSGLIRLKLRSMTGNKDLLMHPGELVEISSNEIRKKRVNPALYDTWTSRKLVFENTSLKEIATMLKENYNLDVEVNDADLLNRKISGTAPINDLTQFLNALSGSFNLEITRDQRRVIIKAAP
jgi:transmembrane sensor